MAFNAKLVPVRVTGTCGGSTSDAVDAVVWASGGQVAGVPANANAARVINLSIGGSGTCGDSWKNAITIARSRNTVLVTGAGNDTADAAGFYPGNCAGVINVAAVDRYANRASYSNYGSAVDLAAPGGYYNQGINGVMMTSNSGTEGPAGDNYFATGGTSIAAPHVAGVAALMLSKNNWLTVDDLESKLKSSARAFPVTCIGCGTGIVDALAAVNAVINLPTKLEVEPNNTPGAADQIPTSGTTAVGNMESTADNDYFSVVLPAGKTLTATLMIGNSTADYDLMIYASDGTSMLAASVRPPGITDDAFVTNTGAAASTYYIRVKYYAGGTGVVNGTYGMKLNW